MSATAAFQSSAARDSTLRRPSARILFLINHPIQDPSCRFRVYQFIPFLQRAGFECEVRPFSTPKLYHAVRGRGKYLVKTLETLRSTGRRLRDIQRIQEFDLVFIHREAFPFFTPAFEKLVLERHRKVIFGFDDAIYCGHEKTSDLPHPLLYRIKYGRGVDEVIRRCALVTPGSNTLAEYARKFSSRVTVVPTVIDLEQYAVREERPSRQVVIGWFGSRSTSPYLSVVEPALRHLAKAYGNRVSFCFYGDGEYCSDLPNSRVIPFAVETEHAELGNIDIGLMPLPDNSWTRGKCSLKALQYMARGVPVVTSPVGMAADVIQHGSNGYWARNEEEWFSYLSLLIDNAALRRKLALAGRKTVEQAYSVQVWAPKLISLFESVLRDAPLEA